MNILFLDIETTGLDSKIHKIIQISAKLDVDGVTVSSFNEQASVQISATEFSGMNLILPIISFGALKVNRRTPSSLITGKKLGDILVEFADYLIGINKEFITCGHNIHFDVDFLNQAFIRIGFTDFESLIGHRFLDTAAIGLYLKEKGMLPLDKINIENLTEYFGLDKNKLHDSSIDVDITADI